MWKEEQPLNHFHSAEVLPQVIILYKGVYKLNNDSGVGQISWCSKACHGELWCPLASAYLKRMGDW